LRGCIVTGNRIGGADKSEGAGCKIHRLRELALAQRADCAGGGRDENALILKSAGKCSRTRWPCAAASHEQASSRIYPHVACTGFIGAACIDRLRTARAIGDVVTRPSQVILVGVVQQRRRSQVDIQVREQPLAAHRIGRLCVDGSQMRGVIITKEEKLAVVAQGTLDAATRLADLEAAARHSAYIACQGRAAANKAAGYGAAVIDQDAGYRIAIRSADKAGDRIGAAALVRYRLPLLWFVIAPVEASMLVFCVMALPDVGVQTRDPFPLEAKSAVSLKLVSFCPASVALPATSTPSHV